MVNIDKQENKILIGDKLITNSTQITIGGRFVDFVSGEYFNFF
jgi:hypothetical protein